MYCATEHLKREQDEFKKTHGAISSPVDGIFVGNNHIFGAGCPPVEA